MKVLRLLLFPFSILYDIVTRVRNYLYDIGHKPSFQFEVTVISVGNLSVGGSGKTPMIEYLIRLLQAQRRIATLSRGYGRRTTGLRFATEKDNAKTVGDEPYQLFRKFGDRVKVNVGEDRSFAIPNILHEYPEIDTILLDDSFQHRRVRPSLSILLTEYHQPFVKDRVLPAGNLRESRKGARRADVIVVTKCPHDVVDDQKLLLEIKKYSGEKPVFFAAIRYGNFQVFGNSPKVQKKIILITGIAYAKPLVDHLISLHEIIRHFEFADHHRFTREELEEIVSLGLKDDLSLVTTEKDMVRMLIPEFDELVRSNPWFYIPMEMVFLKNGAEFDKNVVQAIGKD